jgi:hypothetical protein
VEVWRALLPTFHRIPTWPIPGSALGQPENDEWRTRSCCWRVVCWWRITWLTLASRVENSKPSSQLHSGTFDMPIAPPPARAVEPRILQLFERERHRIATSAKLACGPVVVRSYRRSKNGICFVNFLVLSMWCTGETDRFQVPHVRAQIHSDPIHASSTCPACTPSSRECTTPASHLRIRIRILHPTPRVILDPLGHRTEFDSWVEIALTGYDWRLDLNISAEHDIKSGIDASQRHIL